MVLFGSRARGDEKPDSDYDILVVLEKKERPVIDKLYDGVMDCLMDFNRLVSLKIYSEEQWQYSTKLGTPFSKNVMKEGIPLG